MTHRTRARLAWGVVAVIDVLIAATIALTAAGWSVIGDERLSAPLIQQFVPALTVGFVGGMLAARRSSSRMGWVLLLAATLSAVQIATQAYVVRGLLVAPGTLPAIRWIAWVQNWESGLVYPGAVALILLLFPNGQPPSKRWRVLLWLVLAYMAGTVILGVLDPAPLQLASGLPSLPNPTGVTALQGVSRGTFGYVFYAGGQVLAVAAVVALAMRLRGAHGDERQQLRWVAYVIGVTVAIALVFGPLSIAVTPLSSPWLSTGITVAGFGIGLPVAMGVAVLRYRLYDIDVIISRTLVYGSLAALITGVYVGIAVGIGELVGSGGKPNLGLSILATAIVAMGFQPARERLQRVANRLVYGKRATPYQVLSEFSSHVAGSFSAGELLPQMARVLQAGTGAERAAVWLRSGDVLHAAATHPAAPEKWPAQTAMNGGVQPLPGVTRTVEVRHQGELLGALSVVKRHGESLTPVEEKLLDDLAHQAGLVLKNVGLTADLQRRLEELRASRQRLVSAQDQERRKLERNLHDGAQQHLVALKVKLGLAEMLAVKDPDKARATIAQLKADTDEALDTLRDLARGIYPPLLAEKGLPSALESQARKATVAVTVDADSIGRYPQEVEATVYFCVLEALQNVQKYAEATSAIVRLRGDGGMLRFEVEDDGHGFDTRDVRRGAGLTNMNDRIDALGGSLDITSNPPRGTAVRAGVPIPAAAMEAS